MKNVLFQKVIVSALLHIGRKLYLFHISSIEMSLAEELNLLDFVLVRPNNYLHGLHLLSNYFQRISSEAAEAAVPLLFYIFLTLAAGSFFYLFTFQRSRQVLILKLLRLSKS